MRNCKERGEYSNFTSMLRATFWRVRRPLIFLFVYLIYWFYIMFFGVMAFCGGNMFLFALMIIIFLAWGCIISISGLFIQENKQKLITFALGMIIAFLPYFVSKLGKEIHEVGVYVKFKRYNDQLVEGCELALEKVPEGYPISSKKYKQFQIWSYGSRPTREFIDHKDGIVYISFESAPGDDSGVAYNPKNHKMDIRYTYHMFGPWYRF